MNLVRTHGHDGASAFVPQRPTIDDELRVAEQVDRAWRVGYGMGWPQGCRSGFGAGFGIGILWMVFWFWMGGKL